jgi:hypothetical protein
MTKVYPTDTSRCGACSASIKHSQYVGFYLVGSCAAIGYALCRQCGKQSRTGLAPDLLSQLDKRMEEKARQFGLTSTQSGQS